MERKTREKIKREKRVEEINQDEREKIREEKRRKIMKEMKKEKNMPFIVVMTPWCKLLGACRPWIFLINGFLCFLRSDGSRMEKKEREKMPLQGEDESRRSSAP